MSVTGIPTNAMFLIFISNGFGELSSHRFHCIDFIVQRHDSDFAAGLQKRIDEIGPLIVVFQEIKRGKNIVGLRADEIRTGKVSVTQKAEEVEGGIGLDVKKIG